MVTSNSEKIFTEAQTLMPGGVNSPVRAFKSVGGTPRVIDRGTGAHMVDVDGNKLIDYVLSWGPLVLGHAYPTVVDALSDALSRGTSYGAPTAIENELAKLVIETVPSIEMIRFVNSGTEACMSALRLARAYTGRDKIIKFAGNYHGHADMLLVQAGSGVATFGLPDSPGVPKGTAVNTLTAPYNDLETVRKLFEENPDEIAGAIVEPIAANMGFVVPDEGYLQGLIDLCHEHGALLILDEVMTGFRAGVGGAQDIWNLDPDITCLGKVIGGGLPVGAYAGKRHIMETVAPAGTMYQAGTLSGNPLAMTAGLATISEWKKEGNFEATSAKADTLITGMLDITNRLNVPLQAGTVGTMFGFYFLKEADAVIRDYATAKQFAHTERYGKFYHEMLKRGVYLAPSQYEAGFISLVHTDEDVSHTLYSAEESLKAIL
ncbi:MAG: glutamate-1-semialdehyde 2,1-aminomutase [Chloroflexota bacterium]